jgi:hypothetical protein
MISCLSSNHWQIITNAFTLQSNKLRLSYWENVVDEFFLPSATLRLTLWKWKDNKKEEDKVFSSSWFAQSSWDFRLLVRQMLAHQSYPGFFSLHVSLALSP